MSNIRPNNKAISVVEWAISDPITRQSVLDLIPVRHLLILQCDMQNVEAVVKIRGGKPVNQGPKPPQ